VRSLLGQALQSEADDTIIDMEAGIEHLSRAGGTLANADVLILMMEPSRKAVITAQRTIGLAKELGIMRWIGVGNKIDTDEARQAIEELCADHEVPLDVTIPSSPNLIAADRRGEPLDRSLASDVWEAVESMADSLDLEAVPVA
jgi:CO dehydrogenase maturation factor